MTNKQSKLDITGRACKLYLHELQLCSDKNKSYNNRRREATDHLRPALQEAWKALEAGETVNSCTTKEQWAKWYNPSARGANGIRQIQRIINPKEKATSRRPVVKLTEGAVMNIGGKHFTIMSAPEDANDMTKTKSGVYRESFLVMPVVEEKTAPTDKELKKRYTAVRKELRECETVSNDHADRIELAADRIGNYVPPTSDEVEAHGLRVDKAIAEQDEVVEEMKKRGLLVPRKKKAAPETVTVTVNDGTYIPSETEKAKVAGWKAREALGLHRVNSVCPDEEGD